MEITFRNPNDGIQLPGTLTLPNGAGPFPAVILVVGSGPHTRDVEIGKHRLFFTLSTSETVEATRLLRELATFIDAENRTLFHLDDIDSYFAFMRSPHVLESLDHNPVDVLKRVQCPVLAITGSKDVHVSAKENLAAIENALRDGSSRSYEVTELHGLNHIFQRCRTGLPGEYFSIRETMAPVALETITNWILTVTDPSRKM